MSKDFRVEVAKGHEAYEAAVERNNFTPISKLRPEIQLLLCAVAQRITVENFEPVNFQTPELMMCCLLNMNKAEMMVGSHNGTLALGVHSNEKISVSMEAADKAVDELQRLADNHELSEFEENLVSNIIATGMVMQKRAKEQEAEEKEQVMQ